MTMESLERAATSGISEHEIVRGYSRARGRTPTGARMEVRRERCAIDAGVITAPANDWTAIAIEVRAHNLSTLHAQAARQLGYD